MTTKNDNAIIRVRFPSDVLAFLPSIMLDGTRHDILHWMINMCELSFVLEDGQGERDVYGFVFDHILAGYEISTPETSLLRDATSRVIEEMFDHCYYNKLFLDGTMDDVLRNVRKELLNVVVEQAEIYEAYDLSYGDEFEIGIDETTQRIYFGTYNEAYGGLKDRKLSCLASLIDTKALAEEATAHGWYQYGLGTKDKNER